MKVELTLQQLQRIIESLKESNIDRSQDNLISYLAWVEKDANPMPAQEIDDIPF